MANKKISDLTAASALTGSELIEVEQSSTSKYTTPADLKTYMAQNAPTPFTPTLTGFGTVSAVTGYYWYSAGGTVGNFEIIFTAGTVTGTEARASLPFTTASTYPTLQVVGLIASNALYGNAACALAEASKAYITMGIYAHGVTNGLSKRLGSDFGTGGIISICGSVRIA